MNIIELKNISKIYSLGKINVPALHNISFNVCEGEFIAIMGASGSGKSTLLHILGLLDKPSEGMFKLAGKEVSKLSDNELASLRNKFIGFVFQSFNLLPRISSVENVSLPTVYSDNRENTSNAVSLLGKVGLGDRTGHKPNELSGGEQQRAAIARALVNNPLLILADEPTGNLDSKSAAEIIKILKELNDSGITIVMVTHETDLASAAHRIIKLQDGSITSDEQTRTSSGIASGKTEPKNYKASYKHTAINLKRTKDYFIQAIRSLVSNKTRSILSILGVLIGVACLIAMLALGHGAREDVRKHISHLGSNTLIVRPGRKHRHGVALQAGSVTRLTIRDSQEIREIPGVIKIAPCVRGGGQVVYKNKNWNTQITGTTVDHPDMWGLNPKTGRYFTETEISLRQRVAVIGQTVVENLFGKQNPIGEFIKIRKVDFQVIGVLPVKGSSGWRNRDDEIFIPLNTAMYRLLGRKYIDYIDVQVSDSHLLERVAGRIKKLIATLHRLPPSGEDSIHVTNMTEIQETISSTMKTFSFLLGSIAFISLLVGGIGIMNIMLVSVTERTREIGLRKAIGANNKDILFQFVIESITICIVGGIIGILFGTAISMSLAKFAGWSTSVSISSVALAFSFSSLIGFVFGLWPARKASRLNPIDALRYE